MDPSAKQLAVERLKGAQNVLVTVGANPSVDALAAAIGFSLLLGKLDKHASAVFSGFVPPAIEFLEPRKRFDKDISSLRDFIIALDKDKADKLRYKVEDSVVKIFITPYRTTLTEKDLAFSQGDFNVDAVVALGVTNREDLDNAIKTNGRILHDAAVITMNAGSAASSLGSINWQDPSASSLSEMLVSISESFGSGLLDEQIATAWLTGIVAATERFSNPKTTPKVMTMAAQLMAAGANQQLIATNLAPVGSSAAATSPPQVQPDQIKIDHSGKPTPPSTPMPMPELPVNPPSPIQPPPTPPPLPSQPPPANPPEKTLTQLENEISSLASSAKTPSIPESAPPATDELTLPQVPSGITKPSAVVGGPKPILDSYPSPAAGLPQIGRSHGHGPQDLDNDPALGGTFNATSEEAHQEAISDLKQDRNKTILSHQGGRVDEAAEPPERPESHIQTIQPLTLGNPQPATRPATSPPSTEFSLPPAPSLAEATAATPPPVTPPPPSPNASPSSDVDAARAAVEAAFNTQPFDPAHQPLTSLGAQPLPETKPAPEPPVVEPPQFKIPT